MTIWLRFADDSDVLRQTVRDHLKFEPAILIVAEAMTFQETVQLVLKVKPDALLLDLRMPNPTPLTTEPIRKTWADCRVLPMSLSTDDELAIELRTVRTLDKVRRYEELLPTVLRTKSTD